MQWGYSGLVNVGIVGFAAIGGMAGMLVSKEPVPDAWSAGGMNLMGALSALLSDNRPDPLFKTQTTKSWNTLPRFICYRDFGIFSGTSFF